MGNNIAVRAGKVLTPLAEFSPGVILIEGEKIAAVGQVSAVTIPRGYRVIDAGDKIAVPGFIDTHVHGRDGVEFGESAESTIAICRSMARAGTTSLLPTLGAQPTLDEMLAQIRAVRQAMRRGTQGADIVGIHMEGPFLSAAETARGAQEVECLRPPSLDEFRRMAETAEGTIRKMSIAPELEGALDVIREMVRWGIVPSAAHSAATYEQALAAVAAGLRCATHTFNGMIPFHHRRPGLVGVVLTHDAVHAEMIGDGEHLSVPAMDVLLRCKTVDRVHLVSDNTAWAGLPDGVYPARGSRMVIKERTRVYVEGGTLAGSVAPMNFIVNNVASSTRCSLAEAVRLATLNPARLIGIADRKGELASGKDADLVLMDAGGNVCLTMVRGQAVYVIEEMAG